MGSKYCWRGLDANWILHCCVDCLPALTVDRTGHWVVRDFRLLCSCVLTMFAHSTLFGIGFFTVINAILNYVVDSYAHYAASSLAGVVFVRNIAVRIVLIAHLLD